MRPAPGRSVTKYPWPCCGCGGPVELRPVGRTAFACSDACRAAAWRDRRAGRSGAELAGLQAARRAARAREPLRLTPGEQAIIRYAWLAALGAYCAEHRDRQGLADITEMLSWEVVAGIWPEPFAQAAMAGTWPGDEGSEGVIEAVIRERMKLLALRERTQRGGRTAWPKA